MFFLFDCDLSLACQVRQRRLFKLSFLIRIFPLNPHGYCGRELFSLHKRNLAKIWFFCHCNQSKSSLPFTTHRGKSATGLLPISRPTILLISSTWQDNHQKLKAPWWKSSSQKLVLPHACNTWHLLTFCFHFLKTVYDYASWGVLVYSLAIQSSKPMSDLVQQHYHDYFIIAT